MIIPYTELSAETLNNLLEEFVSREGTDYGHLEYSLESKVKKVEQQLKNGQVSIVYDPEMQTCHIVSNDSIDL